MRIHVSSLGCKLNQGEIDAMAGALERAGHEVVASAADAEVCILNTCAVTHVAAQKSRQALRRLNRENPGARLVVTGCYAELAPAELCSLPGVELVAGNQEKERLPERLGPGSAARGALAEKWPNAARPHTRALVKIQDGCDNACTYCIIHVARGPQRSRPAGEVLADVRAHLADGRQEIVLTGVHIGAYGRDRRSAAGGIDLWALVARILEETAVPRLRLSSIEPWDLPARAFALWQDARLCRHLHLPLQSGCSATLRRMGRRYTAGEFAALVAEARQAIPGLAVTSDVIAGFPGETDEEHAQSLEMVRSLAFARLHVFPFSPRPGTPAAGLPDQVPTQVREERARALRAAGAEGERAFRQQFVGRRLEVLWETARPGAGGWGWNGLTDNYLRVYAESPLPLANTRTRVRLVGLVPGGLEGVIET